MTNGGLRSDMGWVRVHSRSGSGSRTRTFWVFFRVREGPGFMWNNMQSGNKSKEHSDACSDDEEYVPGEEEHEELEEKN